MNNDEFLDLTGLAYYHNRAKTVFADKGDLEDLGSTVSTLSSRVDDIVAEGGEPNVVEIIKKNGVALTPDQNKAVNIEINETLLAGNEVFIYDDNNGNAVELYVDGESGASNDTIGFIFDNQDDGISVTKQLATTDYVDENGGKIDKIKVNGTEQTISQQDKSVDITVPTKVGDLTNDSGFQNANDVAGAITTALANGNDPYVTDSEVDTKISTAVSSVYKYKGSVATVNNLPASGNTVGDVYDVQATGVNYAWDGTKWDELGAYVDTSTLWAKSELVAITTAEIDTIVAGS